MKMIKLNHRSKMPLMKTLIPIKEKLCIATQAGHNIIQKADILYLRADSNYCVVHSNDTKLVCSQTMKLLHSRLQLSSFIKIHKSYVINIEKIEFIDSAFTMVTMSDGIDIPISRARKQFVKDMIQIQFD